MDFISLGKISSPSKSGVGTDLRNKALHAFMLIKLIPKASAVAPVSILHQIHVNSMPHVVVAVSFRFHDGSFYGLSVFPEGASHVYLEKEVVWFAAEFIFSFLSVADPGF